VVQSTEVSVTFLTRLLHNPIAGLETWVVLWLGCSSPTLNDQACFCSLPPYVSWCKLRVSNEALQCFCRVMDGFHADKGSDYGAPEGAVGCSRRVRKGVNRSSGVGSTEELRHR
jgi:hypothetical protein